MRRASEILRAGSWNPADAADRVTLDHDARHRRRFHYHGERGTAFLLDLPRATVLAHGDALRLDDGQLVAVAAAHEDLVEVTARDGAAMLRLAWHIGNRHLPAELRGAAIRLRHDHVINAMLEQLGATVRPIRAPFTPEAGAYSGGGHGGHDHGHSHDHAHDHAHGHSHGH
jgi:urease accessory protein